MKRREIQVIAFIVLLFYSCGHQQSTEQGERKGELYTNPDFGLSLTVPEPLKISKGDFMKDSPVPSDRNFFVLLHAWEEPKFFSTRKGLIIHANDIARYPDDQRSAEAYLRKVVRSYVLIGYTTLHEQIDTAVGGVKAVRADFRKEGIRTSSIVVIRKRFALVFTLTGGSEAEIDDLFQSLNVKFSGGADL